MDIKQIEYYKVLCDTKNFSRAAEHLHIAQPSLSVAIKKLEEELGVKLLERNNKKVMLTLPGSIFLSECENLLKQYKHVEEVMADCRERVHKSLRVAFPSTVGAWLWPLLLGDFQKSHQDIHLEIEDLNTHEILEGILKDEIEIGYGVTNFNTHQDIVSWVMRKDSIKLLVSAEDELAKVEAVDISQLAGRRVIMYRKGSSLIEDLFLGELKRKGVQVELQHVKEHSTVFNLVVQGLGVTVILDETELIKSNNVLRVKCFNEPVEFSSGFFWKKDRYLSQSAKQLLLFFDNSFKL